MKVALYVRVSTIEQSEHGWSIGEQTDRLKKYSESMDWNVYKIYTDAGFSGKDTNRPALQEMISDIKRFDKVVVYKLDRLSRSQKDTLNLIEDVFLTNNVDFVSMSENFDTSTPFGRFMIGILSTFAQLERETIKERMTMGKSARAKNGKWHGGHAPFGYETKDGNLVVDDERKDIIIEIFDRYISGEPFRSMERDFKERNITTSQGSPLTNKVIKYIVSNKAYIGYNRHRDEWIKGEHEPLIDIETFEKAEKRLKDAHVRYSVDGIKYGCNTSYLGGLIYCKKCGARFFKCLSGSKKYGFYQNYECYSRRKTVPSMIKNPNCKNKIWRRDELEKIVFDEIKKLSLNPDLIHEPKPRTDGTEKEINSINKQIDRYLKLYGIGKIETDDLDRIVLPLEEKRNALMERLKPSEERISESDARNKVLSFAEILENGNFNEIREILEALIERIEIDDDDIDIFWNFE